MFDPNCKCFGPTTQRVLNPAVWVDAAPGTYGTSAAYYNNYREVHFYHGWVTTVLSPASAG